MDRLEEMERIEAEDDDDDDLTAKVKERRAASRAQNGRYHDRK